jgi:hypothetical protein
MNFKDVLSAIGLAKSTRANLDSKIAKLQAEQQDLNQRLPHAEDLVAWMCRAIDAQSAEFLARLERWYFKPEVIANHAGVWFEQDVTVNLLAMPPTSPDGPQIAPTTGIDHRIGNASLLALTHFLGPAIKEQIPNLVAKHFPQASKGVRSADRAARLSAIAEELESLTEQRDALDASLKETQRATA